MNTAEGKMALYKFDDETITMLLSFAPNGVRYALEFYKERVVNTRDTAPFHH